LTYQDAAGIMETMAARKKTRGTWGGSRLGAGRPRQIEDRADRTIRFERADLDALDEIAAMRGVTSADLVREAVRVHIARHRRKGS